MERLVNGSWLACTEADLVDGDVYRIPVGSGGWQQQVFMTQLEAPVRIITPRAFYKRLPALVKSNMRSSTDDTILDIQGEFDRAAYFSLDDNDTINAANAFGPAGYAWMTTEEVSALLADGTEIERYNGPL